MAERHGEGLAELSALGLTLARDLHARALAATDDRAAGDLSLAFHRISRCVRQTYALEARLERDRRLALREAAHEEARERLKRVQKKRAQVRDALTALVWTEGEHEESEALLGDLELSVFAASEEDDFLDEPIEAIVERLRVAFGLPVNPPDPDGETPTVVIWRSG